MVVHAYYPFGETRVQREAEALVGSGYEVDIVCLRGSAEAPQAEYRSVHIHRLPVTRRRDGLLVQLANYMHFLVLAAIRVAQLDGHHPYDVVQVHNLPDFMVFCAFIPKLRGRAILIDLHDLMPEFYASRFGRGGSFLARLVRWQERISCRFADHVITVSEHWREALIRRGVPPHKCSVVMNVADPSIFRPPEQPETYPPMGDGLRLIYHGSIPERYGLDLALRAIDEVRKTVPAVHLTIVGSGDHLPALVRMVEELGLKDHVTFEEGCLAEALPAIIRSADLGLVPYRDDVFTDGLLPTKLMEYAAMGLPAIAARTTAIEAYFGGTMVEFFTPGDASELAQCILRLHGDRKRLVDLAHNSARFNERYNWTRIGAEYVALVERLGAQSARRRSRKHKGSEG